MSKLPYGRQTIDQADIDAVTAVMRSDYLTTGPEAELFEAALCERVGAAQAVVVSSGTAALHLLALALEIPSGDRVIVPALTFVACASAFRLAGAEVSFADVDPNTGLMRPKDLEEAFAASPAPVRAVVNVHLNGACGPVEELSAVCRRHEVPMIDDACHALGTRYRDKKNHENLIGANVHAWACVFSFHAVKTATMGEGGAITSQDERLVQHLRLLRNQGLNRNPQNFINEATPDGEDSRNAPWYYEIPIPGLNYRANDLQCALGRSQLEKLDRFVDQRQRLVQQYHLEISQCPDLAAIARPLACHQQTFPAWHLMVVLIDFDQLAVSRSDIMNALSKDGIGTQVHYIPLHLQPYFQQRYGKKSLPGSEEYYRRCLSLPLFPDMAEDDVKYVVTKLRQYLC